MSLSIRPLELGRLIGNPRASATYMRNWGVIHDSPILIFVIEGGESPIIVDTGPSDPDYVFKWHGYRMDQSPDQAPVAALAAAGVDPLAVRLVINTHLHWDHSSNNHLFPNARVIVQEQEVAFARDPVQWYNAAYERLPGLQAPWLRTEHQIETIDGDVELAPGVTAVTLPGHTPGSQGVLVEAASRRYLLPGDLIGVYENWTGDGKGWTHIPSGQFTSLIEYDQSFRKIESLDCEVIPSHDPQVLERSSRYE
jgi:N-acyl homoserine lactone hydrolase